MKLKNKFLSLLLAGIMTFISFNSYKSAEASDENSKPLDFFSHMVISDNIEFSPDKIVTRAEYAAMLTKLLRIDYERKEGETSVFEDVTADNAYISEINAITGKGYMIDISETQFAPEQNLTLIQAVKSIIDMLGYKTLIADDGGFPSGYQKYAQTLGIIKGVGAGFNDFINQRELAKVIYNALDAETLNVEFNSDSKLLTTDKDKTFLTEVLKLQRIQGTLNDNGITGLYAESTLDKNSIRIDDTVIGLDGTTEYVRDFIGRDIISYSTDEDDPILVYACISQKDECVSFDINDYESYTTTSITYNNGKKSVTKNLADSAVMIYNGMAKESFDALTFEFEAGEVSLIIKNSRVSLIIVKKHDYMHVAKMDFENEIIYGSLLGTDRRAEDFRCEDYDYITVYDSDKNLKTFGDIKNGCVVDIEKNAPAATITFYETKADNFLIKSVKNDDGKTIISDGTTQYTVLKTYMDSPYATKPEINKNYSVWYVGNIAVWLETAGESSTVGFLIKCGYDEDNEQYFIKTYDTTGKIGRHTLKNKVTILGTDEKKQRVADSYVYSDALQGYNGILKYKTDDVGIVNYIELPTKNKSANGQIHEIYDQRADNATWTGDGGFQGVWFYNNATSFMSIPADRDNERLYENVSLSAAVTKYENKRTRTSIAYTSKPNSVIAEYVVFLEDSVEASLVGIKRVLIVVDDISTEINEDDEVVQKITGTRLDEGGSKKGRTELYSNMDTVLETDGTRHSAFEYITDSMMSAENGVTNRYNVQPGDIIRAIYDDRMYVSVADLIWRSTMDNPTSQNGKKGWLVGSNGYHIKDQKDGNPYGLYSNGALADYNDRFHASQDLRVLYGSIIKVEGDGILHITTADLTDPGVNLNNISDNFVTYNVNFSPAHSHMILAEFNGSKVTSRVATVDDIKSYEAVGTECSRILDLSHWGVYNIAVIINGGQY